MLPHICPFGLKPLDLLNQRGVGVDGQWNSPHEEQQTIKHRFGVRVAMAAGTALRKV